MSDDCWFIVGAKGHHGYPQPENSWDSHTYDEICKSCGVYGSQVAPYRFRRSNRRTNSHFLQLNWIFDAWFVRPEVETVLRRSGLSGMDFGPALDHKSGLPLDNLRQLVVTGRVENIEISKLSTVTCMPRNEEAETYPQPHTGPFCGTVKYHPPTHVVIPAQALSGVADLALTSAWFGSGGCAYHYTVASQRFAELVRENRWRGLDFSAISHAGHSWRAV